MASGNTPASPKDTSGLRLVRMTLGESCSPVPTSGGRRTMTRRHNLKGHDVQAANSTETAIWCWITMAEYSTSSSKIFTTERFDTRDVGF
ncbi:hypothetical protein ATANTOWER_022786 [Ataeniobius toweri]|uniref:Uncharacterized protein n=1 Tax=Ataeniobius toweri TaxID=208326 RepID=A0ABU7A974_9TELE|nr:hypothetical protein [Ataeniobius toweri]